MSTQTVKKKMGVLTDTFGRSHNYLRISLTERCNFRCVYCMPEEGVPLQPDNKLLSADEICSLANMFVSQGVSKIRLTGGEPLVRKDFMTIAERLGSIPGLKELAITTNGLTLSRKIPKLKEFGLTGVNISLDSLVEAKFNFFTRRQGLSRVLDSIHTAVDNGIPKVKVNTVVMRGRNEDELLDFVALTKDLPIQVRFIEYMPFSGNKWDKKKMFSYFEMLDTLRTKYNLEPITHKRGDTSKNFSVEGHKGSVGFITSMTSNFCSSCTRLRVTADGNLKVCLFGNEEVSLRDMLRAGASQKELLSVIDCAVNAKKKEHAGMDTLKDSENRPMILIGG